MAVAKGRSFPDGTYEYICGTCRGIGQVGTSTLCPDCLALDADQIAEAMSKGVQGQRYYALLKAFLSIKGKAIVEEAKRLGNERGKLVLFDLGYISLKFGLNFRATVEWLEETRCIRTGTYTTFTEAKNAATGKKWRVKDVYEAVLEKHPELKRGE